MHPLNGSTAFGLKIDGRDAEQSSAVRASGLWPNLIYPTRRLLHQFEEKGLLSRPVAGDRGLFAEFSHVTLRSEWETASSTMTDRDIIEAK